MRRHSRLGWLRIGGRLLVLGCLLLALLPPPLPWSRAAPDLFLLVDESLSMPRDYTAGAWRQLRTLVDEAPADTRVHLIRFAANPALETTPDPFSAAGAGDLPRDKSLDRSATNIAGALLEALRMVSPERPAIMVMVSDTAATQGDTGSALQALYRAGVPLYLLAPAAADPDGTASVRDLQMPARVNAGDEVPVVALLESSADTSVTVALEIDGREEQRQLLTLGPGEPALATFGFIPRAPGVKLVTVRVDGTSAGNLHSAPTRAVNVLGPAPLLYVTQRSGASPIADSLRLAGREVTTVSTTELTGRLSFLQQAGAIILDDLAIGDLGEAAWRALVYAVRNDGKGLAVLGGPRSFGAGAYRHSALEQILPVTAEATDPQEPAAVMFLLDRSGSMGQEQAGPSRLSLAREAVAASVGMLLPDDYLGIITFAIEARVRLPLAARQTAGDKVPAALNVEPGGGTRLTPALQLAAQQLRSVDVGQRLIVVVTDGFSVDEDLPLIARDLAADGITVIALAVGKDPNRETLQLLTDFNQGRLLAVSDAATLPRLMTAAVATERAPTVAEATVPTIAQALPFPLDPVPAWPPLAAYMVSKARPAAQVHLRSSRGDPLFATGLSGAGRVAALPAGLGSWASSWWRWPDFGLFLGGLVNWLDPGYGAHDLSLAVADQPGKLLFTIDMQTQGEWDSGGKPKLLVDDPAGARTELLPVLQAPGRYQATLPAIQPGLYQATLQAGGRSLRHAVYRDANREWQSAALAPIDRSYWLEQGWLRPWPGIDGLLAAWPRDASGLRRTLLVLALFNYLLLLILERGLAGPAARRLLSWFSR